MLPLLKYHENIYNFSYADIQKRDTKDTIKLMSSLPVSTIRSRQLTLVDEKDLPEVYMPDDIFDILDRIVETAEKHGTEVLFIATPYCIQPDGLTVRLAMDAYMDEKGYSYLDMVPIAIDEVGLDYQTDVYNINHTNLAGAAKVTSYLAKYLTEHYQFDNNKSEETKEYWDKYVKAFNERQKDRREQWQKKADKIKEKQQQVVQE